ncbi:MAG: radical SAM protein [Candidatus Aminicenantes bacterium]|nr:radical SAM protein [Candidatus Aminicenantes bacterium]
MKKTAPESTYVQSLPLPKFALWDKFKPDRKPIAVEFEITARCNNNCRHCYINQPASDRKAKQNELTLAEIGRIADQAADIGFLWWLITGGEPLLRKDFFDIYLLLRKKGFLISLFTNATLISDEHIKFFKKYPPRNIEVSVYGASEKTYEAVTQVKGSFRFFNKGLERLLENGFHVQLKAMALRSNFAEFPEIVRFCRKRSANHFRIDPFLHLRYDRDDQRNRWIKEERLTTPEIIEIEQLDPDRLMGLRQLCEVGSAKQIKTTGRMPIIGCGAGNNEFSLSYDGRLKLCLTLCHPDYEFDLHSGSLREAWFRFIPRVLNRKTRNKDLLESCGVCLLRNLCQWCPASAMLETGELDRRIDSFCATAHARAEWLKTRTD